MEGKKELINTIVCDQKRDIFAICTSYPNISLCSFKSGSEKKRFLGGPKTGLTAGAFSPNGELFAGTATSTGTAAPCIYIWNVDSEKLKAPLGGHTGLVPGISFLKSDPSKLVTGAHDLSIKIWDLNHGLCMKTIEVTSPVNALISDLSGIITGHQDGTISKYDDRTGSSIVLSQSLHSRPICSLVAYDNLIYSTSTDNTIKSVDSSSMKIVQTYRHETFQAFSDGCAPSISPDGHFLSAGSANGSIVYWNRSTGAFVETAQAAHPSAVVATSWSEKLGNFVSADRMGQILIWQ